MTTTIYATVIDGALQLDEAIGLPDQSRVAVDITLAADSLSDDLPLEKRRKAFRDFVALGDRLQLKIGERDARDQLHDPALLSEAALAADWNRPEEDAAWAHLPLGR